MPEIDVADALEHARHAGLEALALEHASVGEHRREASEQHEHLGSVSEAEVLQRELGEHVVGHVVDENEKQGQTAEEINSQVALCTGACRAHRHVFFTWTASGTYS